MQKRSHLRTKGERGVIPLPPPPSFFQEGITPPTHAPAREENLLPHPARNNPLLSKMMTSPDLIICRDSTRNGIWSCKKAVRIAKGGRGVIPLPPLLLFFRRGSPPHPCAGPAGGIPSPHPVGTRKRSRNSQRADFRSAAQTQRRKTHSRKRDEKNLLCFCQADGVNLDVASL